MRFVAISLLFTLALAGCQSKAKKVQQLQEQYNAEYPAYSKDCLDEDTAGASRLLTGEKLTNERDCDSRSQEEEREMRGANRKPTGSPRFSARFLRRSSNSNRRLTITTIHRKREENPVRKLIFTALAIGLATLSEPCSARAVRFRRRLRSHAIGPRRCADRT